jgi:NSS family neurotransmitter:Na+ symporter
MVLEDFFVSNLALPLGSLMFVIFCVSRYGWGWDKFVAEANEGEGLKVKKWMRPYVTYVLPVMVGFVFVVGILSYL